MAPNASSDPAVFGWQPHWPESQRLAESLRCCRLTLLCGPAGSGKSSLLAAGLVPLLRRRAVDAALHAPRPGAPVIMPFPERRSAARARLAEIVILFDAAGGEPLARLHERIDAALVAAGVSPEPHTPSLADRVQALGDRWGTKFLFIVDRFEELVKTRRGISGRPEMLDELVGLLNRRVPANVLVAVRSEDHALLEPFESRLHAVDPEMMVLPGPEDAAATPPARGHLTLAAPAPERSPEAQTRWHEDSQLPMLGEAPAPAPEPRNATPPFRHTGPVFEPVAHAARRWRWQVPLVLAPLAMVAFALPMVWSDSAPGPARQPGAAQRSADAAPVLPAARALFPARPRLELRVEGDGTTVGRLPAELATALANEASFALDVRAFGGGLKALPEADAGPARLSLVRYDALQAAARSASPAPLAVVAPLYTEEILAVVRADSPLTFMHEIQARRINVGNADSSRALTATNLYRRMFGQPLPSTTDAALDTPDALQRLVAGTTTLDVVLLVAPQPAAALAALPAEARRSLRLLRLAPDHPASTRAMQAYLPATVRSADGAATPTLAAMAFLVATGTQDTASAQTIADFTRALCDSLPGLQARGDAKWREVRPGLQLPTAWPVAPAAEAAWRDCAQGAAASEPVTRQTLAASQSPNPNPGARP